MTRFARQGFLGEESEARFAVLRVGIVGLGGGGSHVVQQLSHIGIPNLVCVDPDIVEESNLNRLIGATIADAEVGTEKTAVAARLARALMRSSGFVTITAKWQDATEALADCDIIVGGLDSYRERSELEAFSRRLLIPYIDMGMDVYEVGDHFSLGGQVILSSPGQPCLWCMGILTQERLEREAENYGAAGGRPQVVWPNGVLASLAVGLLVQLVSPWTNTAIDSAYLEYDGNRHQVGTSNRLKAVADCQCSHYLADQTGDPLFDIRRQVFGTGDATEPDTVERPLGWWKRLWLWLGFSYAPEPDARH